MSIVTCPHPERGHYAHGICKLCYGRKWQKETNHPAKMRKHNLRSKYGLTIEDYDNMYLLQDGKCGICCGTEIGTHKSKYFGVDHCHQTGKIRALLCAKCNTGLGAFKDNTELLQKAIDYLNYYKR